MLLLSVYILQMSAKNAALREHFATVFMWAEIWLVTGMLPEVNLHITALGECAAAAIDEALEGPLVSVGLGVEDSEGLAHRFRDGLESLL